MTDINAIEQQILNGRSTANDDVDDIRTGTGAESGNEEDDEDKRYTSDRDQPPLLDHPSLGPQTGHNTGVKGVRNDARRHAEVQRVIRADRVQATNERMEQLALGKSRTWEEDESDRKREAALGLKPGQSSRESDKDNDDDDDEELKAIRQRRLGTLKSQAASNEARRKKMAGEDECSQATGAGAMFGHLREVGADQYAHAIDTEDTDTYVVVHIYVKYVHACAQLTSALSSLARMHTHVKFIQVRAGSIGFGSGGQQIDDEIEGDEKAEEVVPTMLVYQGGNLVANLVRVDLEAEWKDGQERNIRDILAKHSIPL